MLLAAKQSWEVPVITCSDHLQTSLISFKLRQTPLTHITARVHLQQQRNRNNKSLKKRVRVVVYRAPLLRWMPRRATRPQRLISLRHIALKNSNQKSLKTLLIRLWQRIRNHLITNSKSKAVLRRKIRNHCLSTLLSWYRNSFKRRKRRSCYCKAVQLKIMKTSNHLSFLHRPKESKITMKKRGWQTRSRKKILLLHNKKMINQQKKKT